MTTQSNSDLSNYFLIGKQKKVEFITGVDSRISMAIAIARAITRCKNSDFL